MSYKDAVRCFAVSTNGQAGTTLFAGTAGGGVSRSTNNGVNWIPANNGLANQYVTSLAASGSDLFAGTWGGVFRSTDSGTSWTEAGLTNALLTCLAVIPDGATGMDLVAGTMYDGTFLSTDNGATWTGANAGLSNYRVLSFAVLPGGVGVPNIFAGTVRGGVFLSTDRGTSWTSVDSGLTDSYVEALAVSPNGAHGSNLFAGTMYGGVFLSTNNGVSWEKASNGLADNEIRALAVSGANLFAGSQSGVFLSTDSGTHWAMVSTGFAGVWSLVVSGTHLFSGTYDSGVWTRALSEMITSVGPVMRQVPQEFVLLQNHPNPFNPTTTIEYTVGGTGNQALGVSDVRIVVYDLLGKEVSVLVNERKVPGSYQVTFDAQGLASGVYICRLVAGDRVQSRKMIVLR